MSSPKTAAAANLPRRSWVRQIMGLPISVLARGPAARSDAAGQAVEQVYAELVGVDAVFSTYREDSFVRRLARGELSLADCPPEVIDVAQRCTRAYDLTRGLFQATRPDGTWDPTGLVKGWATERAARHLGLVGEVDWLLNAAGDLIILAPSGQSFTVGVQDPRDAGRALTTVILSGGGMATSGAAARGAHLYDPRTSRSVPAGRELSVSVVGPSLETADVLATAAYVAGPAWAEVATAQPGYAALAVGRDGSCTSTVGWPSEREAHDVEPHPAGNARGSEPGW